MGNRAIITDESKDCNIYIHWNNGIDSIKEFTMANGKTKIGNPEVLGFIERFIEHAGWRDMIRDYAYDTVRWLFRTGYCWHFAVMLHAAFERGKICWAAPFGHVVWVDEDGLPYDIEGLYSGEAFWFIPIEYLGESVEEFKHIRCDCDHMSKDGLIDIMKKYCADAGLDYDPKVEEYLKED